MHELSTAAFHNPILSPLLDLFTEDDYLVGGCIRDLLLAKSPVDFDIVTFGDVWAKAAAIADRFGAHAFWLDRQRGVARIALKDERVKIDVCAPKAGTIADDLRLRDITINAMAMGLKRGDLLDPLDGMHDLQAGHIRIISAQNLADDPLRVLRCLRFAVMLGFSLPDDTMAVLRMFAPQVRSAAPERIKQELMSALSLPCGSDLFLLLEDAGLIPVLFPPYVDVDQGRHHRWPLLKHVILTARAIDPLLADPGAYLPGIGAYFLAAIEEGVSRACILRLAAFLHDIGKPDAMYTAADGVVHFHGHAQAGASATLRLCQELRFSAQAVQIATGIVAHHMRILELACGGIITPRAMHRLLKATRGFTPEVLLLVIADAEATGKDPAYLGAHPDIGEIVKRIWVYDRDVFALHKTAPLLSGHDVMHALDIPSGPEVGRYLCLVEEARADGLIKTRSEALRYLAELED